MVLNPTMFPSPSGNAESFLSLRQIAEAAHSPRRCGCRLSYILQQKWRETPGAPLGAKEQNPF